MTIITFMLFISAIVFGISNFVDYMPVQAAYDNDPLKVPEYMMDWPEWDLENITFEWSALEQDTTVEEIGFFGCTMEEVEQALSCLPNQKQWEKVGVIRRLIALVPENTEHKFTNTLIMA